jgi:trehalose 6-phosphate phosphatase
MKYALAHLPELDELLYGARRVLIATDFDGTLCPICELPENVRLSPGMVAVLRAISACDRMVLAVISGRALSDIACRVPVPAVIAGNHGLEISGGGIVFENPEARGLRPTLEQACDALASALRPWSGAWVEDKYLSATVHFRLVEPHSHRCVLRAARNALASFGRSFALRAGNHALEVRPNVNWEKGSALGFICRESGPFDVVITLGDDRTDETMFGGAPGHVDIKVGPARPTRAAFHLSDSADVAIFLSHVLDFCRLRAPAAAGAA